ncbi:MAG: thermonuclease family protein, partial [Methylohalobius sp.]|nr:thermonuclease family protein [Methylohalobius sp.]
MSRWFAFGVFLLWVSPTLGAAILTGRVVGVSDGDTITLLDAQRRQHRIRLHQIDAPERRQDFGERSRQSLAELVFGKEVVVEVVTTDRYGREVGKVKVDGTDANLEQVKRGLAWVYRQYAEDPAYFAAEEEARAAKRGLWLQPNPIPPWEFRHGKKGTTGRIFDAPSTSALECGRKRTCSEMTSCDEAKHYLQDCGLHRLDGDKDCLLYTSDAAD